MWNVQREWICKLEVSDDWMFKSVEIGPIYDLNQELFTTTCSRYSSNRQNGSKTKHLGKRHKSHSDPHQKQSSMSNPNSSLNINTLNSQLCNTAIKPISNIYSHHPYSSLFRHINHLAYNISSSD